MYNIMMCICIQGADCNSVFPTLWVFSVELYGPAISKSRINHFSTWSQLLLCCVCCIFVQNKVKINPNTFEYCTIHCGREVVSLGILSHSSPVSVPNLGVIESVEDK